MEEIDFDEHFYYDESSPSFLRHKTNKWTGRHGKRLNAAIGDVAGNLNINGYWRIGHNGVEYKTSRVVMLLNGVSILRGRHVDHIDGNPLNNNITNLRAVTPAENSRNTRKNYNSVLPTGVNFVANKYKSCYFVARWTDIVGNSFRKHFKVVELGIMVAFRDAVIYRAKMIEELNSQGAGYTERHGK